MLTPSPLRQQPSKLLTLPRLLAQTFPRQHRGAKPASRRAEELRRSSLGFEPVEPRVLLSGDPLATMTAAGVLELNLSDADDTVVVRQVASAAGGIVVDLTVNGVTETYGSADNYVLGISGDGKGGDDSFQFIDVSVAVAVAGGAGDDQLFGPAADSTWTITGTDAGTVGEISFSGIENLIGAAGNEDTFSVAAAGEISGLIAGGAGGFDVIEVDLAAATNVVFSFFGPQSGTIERDGKLITYDGFEPITTPTPIPGSPTNVTLDYSTAPATHVLTVEQGANPNKIKVTSSSGETLEFDLPSTSLTILGSTAADTITVNALGNFDANLTINAQGGNDSVTINAVTGSHAYTINGDAGDDTLSAAAVSAAIILNGGADNDVLSGGDGNDTLNGGIGDDTYIFGNAFGDDTLTDASGTDTLDFAGYSGQLTELSGSGITASDGSSVSYAANTIEDVDGADGKVLLTATQKAQFREGLDAIVTWAKALNDYAELGMALPIIIGNVEVGVGQALQIAEALDQIRLRLLNQIDWTAAVTTQQVLTAISGFAESGIEHLDRAILGDVKNAVIAAGDSFSFTLNLNGAGNVSLTGITGATSLATLAAAIDAAIVAQQPDLVGKVHAVVSEGRLAIQAIDSEFVSLAVSGGGAALSKLGFKSTAQSVLDTALEQLGNLSVSVGGGASLSVEVNASGVPELALHLPYTATRTTNFAVDLGEQAGDAGIQFAASTTLAATASLTADLDLRLELDAVPAFTLDINGLDASLSMSGAVNADISIGFLGAHVNGSVAMTADPNLSFASGTGITLAQLTAGNIAALSPSFATATSSLDFDGDVTLSSALSGLTVPGTANITISSSDLFSGDRDDVTVVFTDLGELFKFDNINAAGLAGLLGQLAGWLESMGSSSLNDIAIPFTSQTLGDVLDFNEMLGDLLLFDDGDSSILAKKHLVNDVGDALVAAGLGAQLRVEGNGSKLKLVAINPSDTFTVSANSVAQTRLGFAAGPSAASATLTAPSNAVLLSNLSGDAVLTISVNGGAAETVTITEAALDDNLVVGFNIPKLLNGDNSPTFRNAQEFASRLSAVLASISGLDVPLAYDATDKTLSFTIDLDRSLFNADLPLNFNLDLSPIAELSSASSLHVSADGHLQLTVGVDLEDPDPSTLLTVNSLLAGLNGGDGIDIKTAPSLMGSADANRTNYRLSDDAHFKLFLNGSSSATNITLTKDATEGNTSLAQLVTDLNSALSGTGITASTVHNAEANTDTLKLTGGVSVSSFRIEAGASDTAVRELGLGTNQTDTAKVITAQSALRSSVGRFASDLGFSVAINGGAATTVTVIGEDSEGTSGIDASTNNTIIDLVSDVNKALRAAGLQTLDGDGNIAVASQLRADFMGNRLLFTGGSGVTSFTITAANATAATELGLSASLKTSNNHDLVINTHNGTGHLISLDGASDIGDVIQRIVLGTGGSGTIDKTPTTPAGIEGLTFGNVEVAWNDARTGLKLIDKTAGLTVFAVMATNASQAALDLRIVGVDGLDDGGDFDSAINGGQIASVTLADRFYLEDAVVSGDLAITTPTGLNASAVFGGFVGITLAGNGSLNGSMSVGLKDPGTGVVGGRVSLAELVRGLSDIETIVQTPDLSGSGSFTLAVSTSPDISSLIPLGGTPQVTITLNDFDAAPVIAFSGLDNLLKFDNPDFDFSAVLDALIQLSDFLDQFEQFGFLNEDLPLIDVSINDALDFADRLDDAINEALANPAGSIQALNAKLKEALGLPPASTAVQLTLDHWDHDTPGVLGDDVDLLKLSIHLDTGFSDSASLAIPDINIPVIGEAFDLGGSADLGISANLGLDLDLGIDLNSPTDVYVYNSTGIAGTVSATGTDLDFVAALGPFGLTIEDGSATISGTISAGLDLDGDGDVDTGSESTDRILIGSLLSALGSKVAIDVSGDLDIDLPTFFPTKNNDIGAFGLHLNDIDFDDLPDNLLSSLTLPDFSNVDFSQIGLFDSIMLAVDGLDAFLGGLQDVMDGEVFGLEIPFIGDKLSAAGGFIQDFREDFIDPLRSFVEAADDFQRNFTDPSENFVSQLLFDLLGDPVLTGKTWSLDLLKPLAADGGNPDNPNSPATPNGVEDFIKLDTDGETYVQWNFSIGGSYGVGTEVGMDIGVPGLGMESEGEIGISFDWDLDLGFGLSMDEGFFLDIGDDNELFANVDVTLPSSFTGKLGFLQLRAEDSEVYDDHGGMTNVGLAFAIDIGNKKVADDERLGMAEFSKIEFTPGLAAEAVAELQLFLEVNKDLIGGDSVAAGIPKIQTDFILDWGLGEYDVDDPEASVFVPIEEIGDAIGDGLHYIAFNHVSLDAGSFLSDVLGPIVEKVQEITEPIQPLIDVITTPIPVLSDLGPPITLLDIAASFGKVDPRMIYAIADVISLINRIPDPSETGTLLIDFGDFAILDTREGTSSPIDTDLANPGAKPAALFNSLKSNLSGLDFDSKLNDSSGNAKSKSSMQALRSGNAGGGFAFPIFDDPAQIFGLLMGEPAVLVTYDMAPLNFEFDWSTFFSIFGPLGVSINIGFGANIDFAFGYDTLGIQGFIDGDFENPAKLLDGFYVSDTDLATGEFGVDVPEVVLTGELWAAAELNLGVARAGVGGGIFAEVDFDLFDPNHDGRVRINELIINVENEIKYGEPLLAPLAVFDVHGEITAKLFAFLKIDLFILKIDKTFDITPEITLVEFDADFARVPVLATELDNGDLVLNMGRFAKDRVVDDLLDSVDMLEDQPEQFEVKFTSASHVQVRALNLGSDAMNWQDYDVTGKIIAYGDEGDDSVVFSGVGSAVGYLLEGGVDDDTFTLHAGASGAAVIRGDDGDDTITSGGGADSIWGGRGIDVIHAGGGNDIVFGDEGEITSGADANASALVKFDDADDSLYGEGGNDILFGGGGADQIEGGNNQDVLIGDAGRVVLASKAVSDTNRGTVFGNDTLFGGADSDQLYAGKGNDLLDAGAGSDSAYGEDGNDTIFGGGGGDTLVGADGNDVIWGKRDAAASVKDATDASADGNDTIDGNAGDDLIRAEAGNDTIHGHSGLDEIYAGDGNDEVFGEGGVDLIYGGHGADSIDGGADDDIIFGDAGATDFAAVYVDELNPNADVLGNNLPSGLPEHYDFGVTKSNSYSVTLTDMIDTIYSYSGSDFIDGQAGPDVYIIRLQGADNASFINLYDSGNDVAETDYAQIFGTMYDDDFLLRASASASGLAFVALLNEAPNTERINYWNLERMLVTGSFGDDHFALDDVRAETTITGDVGEDTFQVGQLYRSPRDVAAYAYNGVETEDVFATIETTIGWLSDGINRPTSIYGGVGNDNFTVFHNKAVLSLFGEDGDDTFLIKAFALAGSQEPFRDRTDISGGAGVDLVQYAVNAPVNIDGGDGFDRVIIIGTEFGDDFVVTKNGVYGAGLNVNFVNIESLSVDGAEGDDRFYVQSTSEKFVTEIFGGLGSDTFNMSGDIPPVISNDLQGHSGVIRHSIEKTGTIYDETLIAGIAANVYDNDPSLVVVVNEADGNTEIIEGGVADSYRIVLSKQPTTDVFVQVMAPVQTQDQNERKSKLFRVDSAGKTAFTPDGTAITLKFTAANWDTPQIVTVSALDDADPALDFNDDALEGDATGFINHVVTSDIGIAGSPTTVVTNVLVDGNKTTTFTVPGTPFASSDPADEDDLQNLGGYLLLITDGPGAGQSLRVKSVDSDHQLTLWGEFRSDAMPTAASLYRVTRDIEAVRAVTVTVHDDDVAGVIIGQSDNSTTLFENGNTDQITVRLARAPVGNATVHLLSNDGQLSFSNANLVFTNANWFTPVTVTVTAINDSLVEGFHHGLISFTVDSASDVDANVLAAETRNLTLPSAYVGLEHRPLNGQVTTVEVENLATHVLEVRDPSLYSVISNKVVFLSSGGDDFDFITGNVKVTYTWVKTGYDDLAVKPVLTGITDDETPQVLISETGGATNVVENAPNKTGEPWTDTYNVVLSKAPGADVYVDVTVDSTKTSAGKNIHWGQQVTISSAAPGAVNNPDGTVRLKFTAGNWNTAQVVSVRAVNDGEYDGDDTQYFAPMLHTVSEIQGPIYLYGEGGSGSVVASDPLMLHYEVNVMEPTDNVTSIASDGTTMTVNKATLLADAAVLNSKVLTVADLVSEQMTVTIAAGVEEIGQFRLIVAAIDNGDGSVTLTLDEPWDLSGGEVAEPFSAITKYAVSRMSQTFFADEEEQIDYVFVYNEDSPADNTGARAGVLQDSTTVGFADNAIVETFATRLDGKWLSGLGMGAENLTIGGVVHPRGITYGDMEVVELNMGDGADQFTIRDTHVRADGYQTWTLINTGRGNDTITTALNSDLHVLASGVVSSGGGAGTNTFTTAATFPDTTTAHVDLAGYLVKITGGTGAGQQRLITGNGAHQLTVAKPWDVGLDSTSQFEIVGAPRFAGAATAPTLATDKTLTDATASFGTTNGLVGLVVEIIDGAGAGTRREIVANTGTSLTVSSAWDAALDATTRYRVYGDQDGPIAVNLQEGADQFLGSASSIPLVVFGGAGVDQLAGGSAEDILFGDNGRVEYVNESGKIVTLLGLARERLDPQYIDAFTPNTLTDDDGNFPLKTIDRQGLDGFMLSIPDGRGFGQRVQITGNTDDTLNVTPDWANEKFPLAADFLKVVPAGYDPLTDFDATDPQQNPTKYRISLIPEDQTDGVTRDASLVIAIDPEVGDADVISGNGGNDRIFGGKGGDTVNGNGGDDVVFGDHGRLDYTPAAVGGDEGPQRGDFVPATLNRVRTTYDDLGGADVLHGDGGNDFVLGGFGADTVTGDAGDDFVFGDNGVMLFVANAATPANPRDVLLQSALTLSPTLGGADNLSGNAGADVLVGGNSADTLYGDASTAIGADDGADHLLGDNVQIDYVGGTLSTILTTDTTEATGGGDTISGNAGGDTILGGVGGDSIYGDAATPGSADGNDVILGDNGRLEFMLSGTPYDGDATTLDRATTTDTGLGGADVIHGNAQDDVILGGAAGDAIHGHTGNDLVLGDFGVVQFGSVSVTRLGVATPYKEYALSATTTDDALGGADTVYGDENEDVLAGGAFADRLDGGSEDDLVFGDNVMLDRRGSYLNDFTNPRLRTAAGAMYGAQGQADVGTTAQNFTASLGTPTWGNWEIQLLDHAADAPTNSYGNDTIAGGAHDDQIFGQLGDDVIQGDASIDHLLPDGVGVSVDPTTGMLVVRPSLEATSDGDDYIEGNGGNDVVFGDLGQDDIIGGNSNQFSLTTPERRPDGVDTLFGGAGTDLARNHFGDATVDANGNLTSIDHGRDADMILGDNGNIFRIVTSGGTNAASVDRNFNYDNSATGTRLIPRAADLLDYTPGGVQGAKPAADIGAADEIHGESGDDFIYGMVGNDVLFGEGQDDDLIGGYGNEWISGGTGDDGVLGDDGRIRTSRVGLAEPLNGVAAVTALDQTISTPGKTQQATINHAGALKKEVDLEPFSVDGAWNAQGDEFGDAAGKPRNSDDIVYGGLGNDWLHGGAGDDAISGAEALAAADIGAGYPSYDKPLGAQNILGYDASKTTFAKYDEYAPLAEIAGFLLNFDENEGIKQATAGSVGTQTNVPIYSDGNDAIFGDLGNDWIVGGTGQDHLYGGWGNDLLNADDNQTTNGGLNDAPDTHTSYEDIAYGGAGRDVLTANTGGDRLIDWVGEFNTYIVPFAPYGAGTVSRTLQPQLPEYLYALSRSDGADPTRSPDIGGPGRNGEPNGELGVIVQQDFAWSTQTGAPRDPQAGNVQGGARDVLRSADFDDNQAQGFVPDSGTWTVSGGHYQVAPEVAGGDAVSVFNVQNYIPKYFEMQATVSADKPTGGRDSNGYLIFDYQSKDNFKFAGVNVSTNQIEIGHRNASGWIVDTKSPFSGGGLKSGTDYNLFVAVNGSAVTLIVNNRTTLSFAFAPRVDSFGLSHGINDGMVGLGAKNGSALLDNFNVQRVRPATTLNQTVDFSSGTTSLFLAPQSGSWSLSGGRYSGTATTTAAAIDLSSVHIGTPSALLELSTVLRTTGEGGFIYDAYAANEYKFVSLSAGKITLGHVTAKGVVTDAVFTAKNLASGTDYTLGLTLQGTTVSVTLNGQTVASRVYNALVTDGGFGLLSRSGTTSFDTVTVKSDDPALAAKLLTDLPALTTTAADDLRADALAPIVDEAIRRWAASADGDAIAAMRGISFQIVDLPGSELGEYADGVVYLDIDAAGYGWFIDRTPWNDQEFAASGDTLVASDGPAGGLFDLLSVVAHELGHATGLEHTDQGVMDETLDPGVRTQADADALASVIDWAGVYAGSLAATAGDGSTSGWLGDFVNHLGSTPGQRNPNASLRLTVGA